MGSGFQAVPRACGGRLLFKMGLSPATPSMCLITDPVCPRASQVLQGTQGSSFSSVPPDWQGHG
eukprot:5089508-Pyramimonas_sp.AAC.1